MSIKHFAMMCALTAVSFAFSQEQPAVSKNVPAGKTAPAKEREAVPIELQAVPQEKETLEAEDIYDWADCVRKQYKIDTWGEKDGKIFVFQHATAMKKTADPEFGKAIELAFDVAMAQAQADIVCCVSGAL